MATSVASYSEDLHASRWLGRNIQSQKTGSDDELRTRQSLKALAGRWEALCESRSTVFSKSESLSPLATRYGNSASSWVDTSVRNVRMRDMVTSPTYAESLDDLPPNYTATDSAACAQSLHASGLDVVPRCKKPSSRGNGLFDVKIDFSDPAGVRMHAKKKKKAATNWDSDNEEEKKKKEEADAGGDGGDAGAGGGAGDDAAGGSGGGEDPPGGGDGVGGDDGDEWGAAGGKKNKKKKKKNAW
jgi:hypothetical protein